MYIHRTIEDSIEKAMADHRAIVIYGPRRSGKTTLCQRLLTRYDSAKVAEYSCDDPKQAALFVADLSKLSILVRGKQALFIDEAQNIESAGLVIKLLVDHCPGVKVIVTGSSSFELSDKIKESMVGRAYSFTLLPFSLQEVAVGSKERALFDFDRVMRLGLYPEVFLSDNIEAQRLLDSIVDGSLYRDLVKNVTIQDESVLPKLLTALALQVGAEVSYNELAGLLGVSRTTVERYIYLLEKSFVIFRLDPLSSNPRKLLTSRKRKVYFYDLGVRAALANQTTIPTIQNPKLGGIFENLCILERLKSIVNQPNSPRSYYWRSPDSEIDYIEQSQSATNAYEFRWAKIQKFPPPTFTSQYPNAEFLSVNKDNIWEFIEKSLI